VRVLTGPLVLGRTLTPGGMAWGVGNRDEPFELPAWIDRTRRAHTTRVESLAPFAVLVLVTHVTGRASEITAVASVAFLAFRVAHGVSDMMALVPGLTVAHMASVLTLIVLLAAITV
jgi:uncharacterized MAPEG superfamily protein